MLNYSADASTALTDIEDMVEWFWFLFSQKAWQKLIQTARTTERLGELPLHVADLIWLAFYRGQTKRLLAGSDKGVFEQEGAALIGFIQERWPAASDRHILYTAMVSHVTGNGAEARKVFATLQPSEPLIEPLAAVLTVLPKNSRSHLALDRSKLKITKSQAEHVTLISLDRTYFDKYAYQVAQNFFLTNPENGLHFHCSGFDPASDIQAWNLNGSIGWTTDSRDLGVLTEQSRRGYYAAARYIFLPHYLTLYRSVFVADVDGLMLRDVAEIDAEHTSEDIVLSTRVLDSERELNRLPWEAVTACAFLARATTGGRKFVRAVSGYLTEIMLRAENEGRPFWYADQAALYYSWLDCKNDVRFGRFYRPPFKQVGSWRLFQGDAERLEFLSSKLR
ncbi:hypothetical protein [Phaeobacter gallaeciensis]|uniref:hypothetical protein n=1 Tax=Phaeobacter gallaeciensis TaxID=60890 RepID=UPI00237EF17D|nr:hypothetical protein [Phaeobacter gallaeciensis]MDE4396212.1 hypothetical protein [Phaeobacter gallaeciensis]